MMTTRELFNRIMHFEQPDRTPLWLAEFVTEQAERKWVRDEGQPLDRLGEEEIGFDGELVTLRIDDQAPIPTFVPRTLSEEDDYTLTQDIYGNTVRTEKRSSLPPRHYMYVDSPLRTLADWQEMEKRFDPCDPRRLPLWWSDDYIRHLNASTEPVVLELNWGPARGIKNGYMFGFDRYMEILVEEPVILESVFDFWADFLIRYLEQFIDTLELDAFLFMEDGIGFKTSTMVSPAMFERIYSPYMGRVCQFLRSKGVDVIGYYGSGTVEPLIPNLLDAGVNLLSPLECTSGMDAVALRREYGRDLLMVGNISKESLMAGETAIRAEVERKIPYLMQEGGYIPAFDDMVLPDMKLADLKYCARLIKSCRLQGGEWKLGE